MKYNPLRLKDKIIFDRFLNLKRRQLSTYAFTNIFIWRNLFKIFWVIIEDNLCVFFQDKIGTFLYLPPLGKKKSKSLIAGCFKIMDGFNLSRDISRIENVAEEDLEFYRSLGYACAYKSSDYVYRSDRLFQLKGNSFKSKRAGFNYFIKHYPFQYEPYSLVDKSGCMALYKDWMRNRQAKPRDFIYRKMLEDSFLVQKEALANYQRLNLLGRIVMVNQRIRGYTLGFRLNQDTFCILFEITDLNLKGISQFIFRKFCAELKDYQYINIMDDSGLENLRRAKLSYRPLKLIPAYIVKRR
jgi:hypothetical protein